MGEERKGVFESILYEMTMIVAQIHESILHLNDNFELRSAIRNCISW